ncbi:DUF4142 domain-containing protein [uncultured Alsobacter sp.]|uniref:DUF4142 domain-containing protein n=1 Tax=uncultured Alsobacter sp. TaxID=1748258 RepID=UPI0025E3A84D|nr:DUF4142 domain-containing protein [uncultured Alsobacter sp.]
MAVMDRRAVLGLAAACVVAAPADGQDQPTLRFVEAAYASALFQAQISNTAASRDVRPEVKRLAERVAALKDGQIAELAGLARAAGIEVRDTLDLELRTIAENLEPLDFLAMSRRYVEVETQALDREIAAYREAAAGGAVAIRDYARGMLPRLEELATAARSTWNAVKP